MTGSRRIRWTCGITFEVEGDSRAEMLRALALAVADFPRPITGIHANENVVYGEI